MTRLLVAAVLASLAHGDIEPPSLHQEQEDIQASLLAAQKRLDALAASTDRAEAALARNEARADQLVADLSEAAETYRAARRAWDRAGQHGGAAAENFEQASGAFDEVAAGYRRAAFAIVAVAASAAAAQAVCSGTMSTRTFRAKHGLDDPAVHVDHIIPHADGGADHPLNYQRLSATKNMSCGAGCLGEKLAATPMRFTLAAAVSALAALGCP